MDIFYVINMIFSYFTDVSLISIILFVCCAYVVLIVNHLSEGLSQKKNYKFTISFRVNWIMKYKKMTALCLSQLFMEGSRFKEFRKM